MLACSLLQDFEFDIALWSSFVSFLVFIGIELLSVLILKLRALQITRRTCSDRIPFPPYARRAKSGCNSASKNVVVVEGI